MSEYEKLCEVLTENIGKGIIVIDKRGRQNGGILMDVWDNTIKVEHTEGFPVYYPITGEYDFKPL